MYLSPKPTPVNLLSQGMPQTNDMANDDQSSTIYGMLDLTQTYITSNTSNIEVLQREKNDLSDIQLINLQHIETGYTHSFSSQCY